MFLLKQDSILTKALGNWNEGHYLLEYDLLKISWYACLNLVSCEILPKEGNNPKTINSVRYEQYLIDILLRNTTVVHIMWFEFYFNPRRNELKITLTCKLTH